MPAGDRRSRAFAVVSELAADVMSRGDVGGGCGTGASRQWPAPKDSRRLMRYFSAALLFALDRDQEKGGVLDVRSHDVEEDRRSEQPRSSRAKTVVLGYRWRCFRKPPEGVRPLTGPSVRVRDAGRPYSTWKKSVCWKGSDHICRPWPFPAAGATGTFRKEREALCGVFPSRVLF